MRGRPESQQYPFKLYFSDTVEDLVVFKAQIVSTKNKFYYILCSMQKYDSSSDKGLKGTVVNQT